MRTRNRSLLGTKQIKVAPRFNGAAQYTWLFPAAANDAQQIVVQVTYSSDYCYWSIYREPAELLSGRASWRAHRDNLVAEGESFHPRRAISKIVAAVKPLVKPLVKPPA